jgi:SnoaL-like domain
MTPPSALATARAYHDAWTTGDMDHAGALLADDLAVEVPLNHYPDKTSFTAAVAQFGALVRRVELLSQIGTEQEAMLLYDMDVENIGGLRVAEHFAVRDGLITRVRHIHDAEPIRRAIAPSPD